MKLNQLEYDLRKKSEEYDSLRQEYNICKDKIPDLKNKLENIHKSKLNFDNEEINNIRESFEFNKGKRSEIKKSLRMKLAT